MTEAERASTLDALITKILNRRVQVEQKLIEMAAGKRPLPDASECRAMAQTLGDPPAGSTSADLESLRGFAREMFEHWPDVGGLDGFDMQLLGVKFGLLAPSIKHAPCREDGCNCADGTTPAEWAAGIECFRKTDRLQILPTSEGSV